jgi:hypothetical protein
MVAAACGEVAAKVDAGADTSPGGAPTVVSVTPDDGAKGVVADAEIRVVFSTAMNAASVEAAWQSTDLPASAVTFVWNDTGNMLEIVPTQPLELAEGTGLDPSSVTPRTYAFSIAAGARNIAGTPLAAPLSVSFTTLRRMQVELRAIGPLTRTMRGDGLVLGETAVVLPVGDTTGNLQYKAFASFDLPVLPAGATLAAGVLRGSQNSTVGTPYLLGTLDAKHVNTAAIDAAAFGAAPLANIGALSTAATTGVKSIDVTARLADDLANAAARGNRTQYRLEFPTATNSDAAADEARFGRSGFGLLATYHVE